MNIIKEYRKAQGLTRKQVSEASGVPLRTIQKYENGECQIHNMTLGMAVKISTALSIPFNKLYDYLVSEARGEDSENECD